MIYLDTSYIAKCYLNEPGTDALLQWLEGVAGLSCSLHGRLEFYSTVKRHVREGRLKVRDAGRVLRQFEADERIRLWNWIPVSRDLIFEACSRMERLSTEVSLRSADALHLTCAAVNGFSTVYSHDKHLLSAAPHFGIKGEDIL